MKPPRDTAFLVCLENGTGAPIATARFPADELSNMTAALRRYGHVVLYAVRIKTHNKHHRRT